MGAISGEAIGFEEAQPIELMVTKRTQMREHERNIRHNPMDKHATSAAPQRAHKKRAPRAFTRAQRQTLLGL